MTLRIQKENIVYSPNYARTKITDAIHRKFALEQIMKLLNIQIKKNIKKIKKQKLEKK